MATTVHSITTAQELLKMPSDRRCELVRGELRGMAPSGFDHGAVTANLTYLLKDHVKARNLGAVVGAETGFMLSRDPDTVRAPDIAFVRRSRMKSTGRPVAFWSGAPDLAVEVVSPRDPAEQVEEKVEDYLAAGTLMVWVVNPKRRTITVHRPHAEPVILRHGDPLDGQDVIPGFRCPVREVFA